MFDDIAGIMLELKNQKQRVYNKFHPKLNKIATESRSHIIIMCDKIWIFKYEDGHTLEMTEFPKNLKNSNKQVEN